MHVDLSNGNELSCAVMFVTGLLAGTAGRYAYGCVHKFVVNRPSQSGDGRTLTSCPHSVRKVAALPMPNADAQLNGEWCVLDHVIYVDIAVSSLGRMCHLAGSGSQRDLWRSERLSAQLCYYSIDPGAMNSEASLYTCASHVAFASSYGSSCTCLMPRRRFDLCTGC